MHDYTSGCTVILTTGPSLSAVELEIHGKTAPISIQIHNFLSLCPPPQISTVEAMTPQITLGIRISGGHRPEIKKNGFQNAYFFRSYFPIQNTCNWVSHSAIAYAYGSKMWRASSLIISRNVRKHRACIKQRNLQWRCVSCLGLSCRVNDRAVRAEPFARKAFRVNYTRVRITHA